MRIRLVAGSLLVLLAVSASWAQPLGTAFTYQGRLKNAGSPANGSFNMDFTLYPVPAGGTLLASQTLPGVSATDGLFTVQIDFGAGVFDGNKRWLDVTVNGTPLVPRQELTAAPNAFFALNASTATTATTATSATTAATATNATQLNGQAASFYQNASNINSGTLADPRLSSNVALLNTAQTFSAGKTFSAAPSFTAAGSPFSVTSTTLVANLNADRLDGLDSTAFLQSIPVPLTLSGTSATHIIRGENASTTSGVSGVFGSATGSNTNYGVYGQSASPFGTGVYGTATSGGGTTTYGGYLQSSGMFGRGVYGVATDISGGTHYGVLGSTIISGYGVFATGDMGASGAKSFRIDHPDDPANKYLLHYAAESPEVINFYRGTVVLDGTGEAVVELPHYFAKINKAPSYQLTAVGAPMPMLHVAEKIDEAALNAGAKAGPGEAAPACSFRIAGGAPGAKVSWRVEALRNDRWVQQRGAPVEVDKQDLERGTYQHPELYGQPPEKGMNYHAEHACSSPTCGPGRLTHSVPP